jgi:histidinol-phosphate aminotransferase
VRASSNEAPGPTPEDLVAAVADVVRQAARYPQLAGADLAAAVADRHGLAPANVAVGDGALSLLDRTLLAFVTPGDEVVMAWRSYEAYPLSTRVTGGRPVPVPLTDDGRHDLDAMAAAVGERTRVVLLCNPNNPTGTTVPWPAIEPFLDRLPPGVLAILDEAYVEYADVPGAGRPAPAELVRRPNVALLRTFSKAHAMAGLRAGYLVGHRELVAAVRSVSPPFPVSTPAVAAALCSLAHPEWVEARVAATRAQRSSIAALLRGHGLEVLPSQANFVWTPLGDRAVDFAELAAAHGVLVRPFPGEGVRITVGDPQLADALTPALAQWSTG